MQGSNSRAVPWHTGAQGVRYTWVLGLNTAQENQKWLPLMIGVPGAPQPARPKARLTGCDTWLWK